MTRFYKEIVELLRKVIIISFLVIFPLNMNSFGFGIRGWLGKQIDKGAGILGIPSQLATGGSMNDLHKKLNSNIDHLDGVLTKNVTLFTTQLNEVLRLREDQLDTLLKNNISDLNKGLAKNIETLNNSIDGALGTVRYEQSVFDESLWRFTKNIAQLGLIVLTVFFLFQAYSHMQRNGGSRTFDYKNFFNITKFYLVGFVVAFFIVGVFQPLSTPFIDKKFEKQKDIVKGRVQRSFKDFIYQSAIVNSTLLTKLEPYNAYYEYGRCKAILIKELYLEPEEGTIESTSLTEAFGFYDESYQKYKEDPEYFFLKALFQKKHFNSKKGNFLAALFCLRYLEAKENNPDPEDLFQINGLEPQVIDILGLYNLNPYDLHTVENLASQEGINLTDQETKLLTGNQGLNENQNLDKKVYSLLVDHSNYPVVRLRYNIFESIHLDQRDFFYFLTSNKRITPMQTEQRWMGYVNWFKNMDNQKYWATKYLLFNDALAYGILKNETGSTFTKDESDINVAVNITAFPTVIQTELNTLFRFEKLILSRVLNYTSNDLAKAAKTALVKKEITRDYLKVDSIIQLNAYLKQSLPDSTREKTFSDLIELSAELNLYYIKETIPHNREPLAYYYIWLAQNTLKIENSKFAIWKRQTDKVLEQRYYDY